MRLEPKCLYRKKLSTMLRVEANIILKLKTLLVSGGGGMVRLRLSAPWSLLNSLSALGWQINKIKHWWNDN